MRAGIYPTRMIISLNIGCVCSDQPTEPSLYVFVAVFDANGIHILTDKRR